jgi:methionyl-tRNA formyltransferase
VFVGGVDVSRACLEALCQEGLRPALTITYDESRSDASGYADMRPIAQEHGLELVTTANVNDEALVARVRGLAPVLIYVIGWSQLVKKPLLELPEQGCVGIHPTRLPEGRGRAPIPWTILKGLRQTASTMFGLTEGVDEGDVIGRVEVDVDPREDATSLYAKHRDAHVELVRTHTGPLLDGSASRTPQDDAAASYWPKRDPEDGRIDWTRPADEVDRLVRAVTHPFPGAFTDLPGGRETIWRAEPAPGVQAAPGTWLRKDGETLVACGAGALRVLVAEGPEAVG